MHNLKINHAILLSFLKGSNLWQTAYCLCYYDKLRQSSSWKGYKRSCPICTIRRCVSNFKIIFLNFSFCLLLTFSQHLVSTHTMYTNTLATILLPDFVCSVLLFIAQVTDSVTGLHPLPFARAQGHILQLHESIYERVLENRLSVT